jgi:hypothetical protein
MCVFAFFPFPPLCTLNLRISNLHDGVNINFYPLCNNIGFSIDSRRPRQVGVRGENFGKTAECEMYDDAGGEEEAVGPDR